MVFKRFVKGLILVLVLASGIIISNDVTLAQPTFQVYIDGAIAGELGGNEDTWFSLANPFDLVVVGAYGPNTTSITDVTLLVSVPEGEIGAISIDSFSPLTSGADRDILTDVLGVDGYSTKSFLPTDVHLNHYPVQDDVSDFLIYNLSSFGNGESNLNNYDAGDGTITSTSASGEQKEYTVSYTGFSSLHFDVYGFVTNSKGPNRWANNPGSHDSTAVIPEPSTLILLWTGLLGFMGYANKKMGGR